MKKWSRKVQNSLKWSNSSKLVLNWFKLSSELVQTYPNLSEFIQTRVFLFGLSALEMFVVDFFGQKLWVEKNTVNLKFRFYFILFFTL